MSDYWIMRARRQIQTEELVDTALAALPWALVLALLWRVARGH